LIHRHADYLLKTSSVVKTLLLIFPLSLIAQSLGLPTRDQNPFIRIFPLPANITIPNASQQFGYDFDMAVANIGSYTNAIQDTVYLDGETQAFEFTVHYAGRDHWELALAIPIVRHTPGNLDRFIYDFHRALGFPQGRRSEFPPNQFHYRVNGFRLDQPMIGIGDVQLRFTHLFDDSTWLAGEIVEFPTGRSSRLSGNDGVDGGLFVFHKPLTPFSTLSLQLHGGLGGLYAGRFAPLAGQQRHWVGWFRFGLIWPIFNQVTLYAQWDGHTPFYNINTDQLGITAAGFSYGLAIRPDAEWEFVIFSSEDARVSTTPDVSFGFGIRRN